MTSLPPDPHEPSGSSVRRGSDDPDAGRYGAPPPGQQDPGRYGGQQPFGQYGGAQQYPGQYGGGQQADQYGQQYGQYGSPPGQYGAGQQQYPGQYGGGAPPPDPYGGAAQPPGQYGQQAPGQYGSPTPGQYDSQAPGQYGAAQQYPGQSGQPGQYGAAPQYGQYGGAPQYPDQYGGGQQYPGEQYPGQQYPGQQYPGQGYPAQQYPGQYGGQFPAYPGAAPLGAVDPLVSRSFSEWFSKVVGVVKRSWLQLAVIQLVSGVLVVVFAVVVALAAGASALLALDPTTIARSLGSLFGAALLAGLLIAVFWVTVYAIALGMSTHVVVRAAAGRPATFGEAFAFARARALPMIGWGLAVALGVGLVVVVIGGGAAFTESGAVLFLAGLVLLVGYLYLAVVLLPTFPGVVALERQGVGRMFGLAHRSLAPTAGRVLLFLLAAVVYNVIMSSVIGAITGDYVIVAILLSTVLVSLPIGLAASAVSIATYAGLRHQENPAVTTQTLAAETQR